MRYWTGVCSMIFLGMIFLTAGAGKVIAGSSAFDYYARFAFLPQPVFAVLYAILPYVEIALGVVLIIGIKVNWAIGVSGMLILAFAMSNAVAIHSNGGHIPCPGCFGSLGGLTSYSAMIMDTVMAASLLCIAYCHKTKPLDRWFIKEA